MDESSTQGRIGRRKNRYGLSQSPTERLASDSKAGRPKGNSRKIVTHTDGGKREHIPERYDLLPERALRLVAKAFGEGAEKYGDNNWRKLPDKVILNHALSHVVQYMCGDRSEPHMSHAAANLLMLANKEVEDEGREER